MIPYICTSICFNVSEISYEIFCETYGFEPRPSQGFCSLRDSVQECIPFATVASRPAWYLLPDRDEQVRLGVVSTEQSVGPVELSVQHPEIGFDREVSFQAFVLEKIKALDVKT